MESPKTAVPADDSCQRAQDARAGGFLCVTVGWSYPILSDIPSVSLFRMGACHDERMGTCSLMARACARGEPALDLAEDIDGAVRDCRRNDRAAHYRRDGGSDDARYR